MHFLSALQEKGTVPNIKGIIAPLTPIAVPIINLVRGTSIARSIIKGIALKKFINLLKTSYIIIFSIMPNLLVTIKSIPKKPPMKKDIMPE